MTDLPAEPSPRKRRVFNVLAWITMILFAIFVVGMTVVSVALPRIHKARLERFGR